MWIMVDMGHVDEEGWQRERRSKVASKGKREAAGLSINENPSGWELKTLRFRAKPKNERGETKPYGF
jgi:hypothetical protein